MRDMEIDEVKEDLCELIENKGIEPNVEEIAEVSYSLKEGEQLLKDPVRISIPLTEIFENRMFLGRISEMGELGVLITEEPESGVINIEKRENSERSEREALSKKAPVIEDIYNSVKDYLSDNFSEKHNVCIGFLDKPEAATLYTTN